jgi:hypothetical protein
MSNTAFAYDTDASNSTKSRNSALRVNKPGDSYEVEADRVAEKVASGGRVSGLSASPWQFSSMSIGAVQRDSTDAPASTPEQEEDDRKKQAALDKLNHDLARKSAGPSDPSPQANAVDPSANTNPAAPPKPNNYGEALKTTAGAIAKTDVAKKQIEALKKQPIVKGAEKILDTTAGKIAAGTVLAGAVGGLAVAHQPLPFQLPALPLGKSGYSIGATAEGKLNRPTAIGATLSYSPQKSPAEEKKARLRAAQDERDARAWEKKDLQDFQEGLKTPEQRKQEEEDSQAVINNWVRRSGGLNGGIDVNKYIHPAIPNDAKEDEVPVQRKAIPSAEMHADPEKVESVVRSSGRPLDAETRRTMESRIGFDFSKVRIHTDAKAAASARSLGAHAYTMGSAVVFGEGEYSPQTTQGRRLMAHELTHVVQQNRDIARKK